MNLEVIEPVSDLRRLQWRDLSDDLRGALAGKLSGLWGAVDDEVAFNALAVDKQQALLLVLSRLREKDLWRGVRNITNLYGEGGVGVEFRPWPIMESTLSRRKDFTRRLANHKDTSGGFYEKGRPAATLHFLYVDETQRRWSVHFDLYSPVYSPISAYKHFRYEYVGQGKPDWQMIRQRLKTLASPRE